MNIRKQLMVTVGVILWVTALPARADIDARIYWGKRVAMGFTVSGTVDRVPVEAGTAAKKGEMLMSLEQTPFRTAVVEAKAALAQATGARKESRRDYTQTKELYDRGLLSTVELENAQLKKESSEAAFIAAQARLERAQYELSRSAIHAPFDGLVLSRNVSVGQSIVSTQQVETLLTFAARGEYVARGLVGSKTLRDVRIGDSATVKANGKTFSGKISAIGLEPVDSLQKGDPRYELSVRFNSADVLLRAGTDASIDLK
jgi:RND family efflux transporter MFP subunit